MSGEPKKAKENEKENGKKMERRFFGGQAAPRVYDLLPKRGHFTCPLPEQTQQRFGKQSVPNSGNRVFPMGLRKSAVCGILKEAKHGLVFPGCLTNWNLTGRQNVSLRTSAHAGVAISIEFRNQERHTP